jgi:flagellar assembly protein FliH
MALIKRADIEEYTRESYVMDLGDLKKRGQALTQAANTQAEQVLRDAHAEREQLISSAANDGKEQGYKEGFEQGHAEGVAQGIKQAREDQTQLLNQLTEMWIAQLDAFEQQRDAMLEQSRTQIVELGAMIAARVTRRVIELDPQVVEAQIQAVLSSVTESTRLVLSVHPDDIEIAQAELHNLVERFATCEHAQVTTDASLERGSCIARTASGGIIDASVNTQLERIIDALLPNSEIDTEAGKIGPESSPRVDEKADQAKGDAA